MSFQSTKIIELGSCAFRQWKADHSHCKFIHGYRLIAKFWFGCHLLDNKNWVVDFGGLKELKQVLENQFDHTLCVAADDPHLELFKQMHNTGVCDLRIMQRGVGIERTAEWCFDVADSHIRGLSKNRCYVERVEVWEHEKNSAIYAVTKDSCCCKKEVACPNTLVQPLEQVANVVNAGVNVESNVETVGNSEPKPAQIGNKVTTGWSNPFGGTSWGL